MYQTAVNLWEQNYQHIKKMLNKANHGFKDAIQQQSNAVLSTLRQKQEDSKPKPLDPHIKRDYNFLIVMRHSKRIDQHPKFAPQLQWNEQDQYCRPYDPPLCDFQLPLNQIKEVQTFIPTLHVTKLIVSPFLRCIQTAAVIAKYLNCSNFEIDARLGENALAINRCIKHAKNKQKSTHKTQYKVPDHYTDVEYLTINEMKRIILALWNSSNKDANNEEKCNTRQLTEQELNIEWIHKENAGNHLHVECAKQYREMLLKNDDYLVITHGQVVSDISEALCGKILTVDECGWFGVTPHECMKIYSPTSVHILFDKNAELNAKKRDEEKAKVTDFDKLLNAYKAMDCKRVLQEKMNIHNAEDLLGIKAVSPMQLEQYELSWTQQMKVYQLYYAVREHYEKNKAVNVRLLLNDNWQMLLKMEQN
eukprot:368672_1